MTNPEKLLAEVMDAMAEHDRERRSARAKHTARRKAMTPEEIAAEDFEIRQRQHEREYERALRKLDSTDIVVIIDVT